MPHLNTIVFADKLEQGGFADKQAKALALALAMSDVLETLTNKEDLAGFEIRLELKGDVKLANLKVELIMWMINRGLGLSLVKALQLAGARKIYAAASDPSTITLPGVHAIKLDVTNAADIAAAVQAAPDLTILINNAGIMQGGSVLAADAPSKARAELEANFFAPLAVSTAFAPTLKANGGGAIVNVLSVLSWLTLPGTATYSASKAAAWAMTNGLRGELQGQGTQVLAAHMGVMDTDMAKDMATDKVDPATIAREIFAALEANQDEVLTDETSRQVKAGINAPRSVYLGEARA